MKKYLVPCVALVGIALLSPRADAANLIIKSRAINAGHPGSIPIGVSSVGGSGQLWGLDMGLKADNAAVTAVDPANAFTLNGGTASDVTVTGNTFVGGGTQPTLYAGFVKGTAGVTANTTTPVYVGLLKLQVAAGTLVGTLVDIAPIASYNVKNDGTGNDVSRVGATAVTSTATAGADVVAEAVTTATTLGTTGLQVPLHKVVVAVPGNITLDTANAINSGDLGNLAAALVNKVVLTPAKLVAADIAPANGYVPGTNIGGTAGASYGDGVVNSGDLGLLAAKLVSKASAANFPVSE